MLKTVFIVGVSRAHYSTFSIRQTLREEITRSNIILPKQIHRKAHYVMETTAKLCKHASEEIVRTIHNGIHSMHKLMKNCVRWICHFQVCELFGLTH